VDHAVNLSALTDIAGIEDCDYNVTRSAVVRINFQDLVLPKMAAAGFRHQRNFIGAPRQPRRLIA
jgi:hypothetical protein